jgi:Flp pilus assembly protein TadG
MGYLGGLIAMGNRRMGDIIHWYRRWLPDQARHSAGNIALYMAVMLTSLMGLAGAGVDYGLIVVETSRLQHALDAASLAGARALVTSTGSTQTLRDADGEAAAVSFLGLHGYVNGQNGATFTYVKSSSDSTSGASHDTMQVSGTIVKATSFWKVIGINSTTLNRTATAVSSGGMVDVMLSLDLTKSMDVNGTDMPNLRAAVVAFINQMQLSTTDPRGSQVGIARWAGTVCSWTRGVPPNATTTRTPTPASAPDGDTRIDWNKNEYTLPCFEDSTVLTYLSQTKDVMTKVANNSGTAACPTKPAAPSTPTGYSPGTMAQYACSLDSYTYPYTGLNVVGTPVVPTGIDSHTWSGITGTNLTAAIKIVNGDRTGCYAWATSTSACPTNGRNDPATTGMARKVLVIVTDGFSQLPADGIPSNYPTYTTIATPVASYSAPDSWNKEVIDLADRLKKGPDNNINTLDDNVEIYVVGFFPTPYVDDSSTGNWARSKAAAYGTVGGSPAHPCPAATMPSSSQFSYAASSVTPGVDELLNKISSSTAGTCNHYFPIAKGEGASLPQLFQVMAGSIARGRLQ